MDKALILCVVATLICATAEWGITIKKLIKEMTKAYGFLFSYEMYNSYNHASNSTKHKEK